MKSAWPGWVALVGLVIAWDVVMPRFGFETMTRTWRRWRTRYWMIPMGLDAATDWLGGHLGDHH